MVTSVFFPNEQLLRPGPPSHELHPFHSLHGPFRILTLELKVPTSISASLPFPQVNSLLSKPYVLCGFLHLIPFYPFGLSYGRLIVKLLPEDVRILFFWFYLQKNPPNVLSLCSAFFFAFLRGWMTSAFRLPYFFFPLLPLRKPHSNRF